MNYDYDKVIGAIDNTGCVNNCINALNNFRDAIKPMSDKLQGTSQNSGINKNYTNMMEKSMMIYGNLNEINNTLAMMLKFAKDDKSAWEEAERSRREAEAQRLNNNKYMNNNTL